MINYMVVANPVGGSYDEVLPVEVRRSPSPMLEAVTACEYVSWSIMLAIQTHPRCTNIHATR